MRAYIAGPMSGLEDFNYPAFNAAAKQLREHGVFVVNPAELDEPGDDRKRPWTYYLKRDLAHLLTCDAIAVLPGWQASKGASLEVYVAKALDLPVLDAATLEPVTETVLQEAARVVDGPRRSDYGHPRINHGRTAAFWAAYLGIPISAEQVCYLNILQKIARSMQHTTRDTLTDICGYSRNIEMLNDPS